MKEEIARLRRVMITFGVLFLVLTVLVITGLSITAVKVMSEFSIL